MNYAPCPFCRAASADKVSFTWWGGIIGPRILNHVKCRSCGKGFNGKTGADNKNGIIIYCVIVGIIAFAFVLVLFFLAGLTLFVASG